MADPYITITQIQSEVQTNLPGPITSNIDTFIASCDQLALLKAPDGTAAELESTSLAIAIEKIVAIQKKREVNLNNEEIKLASGYYRPYCGETT